MVGAGDVLFTDRRKPWQRCVAPASGRVVEIRRSQRRYLDRVVIETDGVDGKVFSSPQKLDRESLTNHLIETGAWMALRTRPFDDVPDPGTIPHAVFVTAMDTRPLAANPAVVIARFLDWFAQGLSVLPLLTDGPVHLCHGDQIVIGSIDGVNATRFAGPHPAGLVGTHIHHLHPVRSGRSIWHIGYQDVIAIGHLLATGRIWTHRVIALAGTAVSAPCLTETTLGADLRELCSGRIGDRPVHLISGSPLDGRLDHYLGRGHLQMTANADRKSGPAAGCFTSWLRGLLAPGGTAIVPNAAHERAAPSGILPIPFLRAISVGDTETARALGALGLGEEDLALLTYVDGRRTDFGLLLRRVLDDLRAMS